MNLIDARTDLPDPRKDPMGYSDHLFTIAMNASVGDQIQTPRSLVEKTGHRRVKVIERKDGPYPYYKNNETAVPNAYTYDSGEGWIQDLIIPSGYVHLEGE